MAKLKEVLHALPKPEIERIAREAGTTHDYLVDQLANGHRRPSVKLARRLVELLPDQITLQELRPDIFEGIAA